VEIKVSKFQCYLLNLMLLLVLLKATGVGFGYPNMEHLLGGISYFPQQVMQMITFGLLLIYFFLLPKELQKIKVRSPLIVMLLAGVFISLIGSPYFSLSLRFLLSSIVLLMPVILFLKAYKIDALYKFMCNFLLALLFISVFYTVVFPQYAVMEGIHSGAFRGVFKHKNMFGVFCVLTSIFCLTEMQLASKRSLKVFYMASYLLCLGFVFSSKSATSLVLFLLLTISYIFFLYLARIKELSKRVFVYYFFILTLLLFTLIFSTYYEDILYILGKDSTLTGRTGLWEVLFYVAMDKPLFGHGLGVFVRPEIMIEYSSEFGWAAQSAHNSYLDLILGLGFFGGAAFLLFVFSKLFQYPFFKNTGPMDALAASGIVLCLCFGMSESGAILSTNFIWVYFIFFLYITNEVSSNEVSSSFKFSKI